MESKETGHKTKFEKLMLAATHQRRVDCIAFTQTIRNIYKEFVCFDDEHHLSNFNSNNSWFDWNTRTFSDISFDISLIYLTLNAYFQRTLPDELKKNLELEQFSKFVF